MTSLADALRTAMQSCGITQAALARATGMDPAYLSRLLCGRLALIWPSTATRLEAVLGVPLPDTCLSRPRQRATTRARPRSLEAARLAAYAARHRLTQAQLADRLGYRSTTYINGILSGRRAVSARLAKTVTLLEQEDAHG